MSGARKNWVALTPDTGLDRRATPLTACRPFIENTRGVLIHRPRHATVYRPGGRWPPHLAVSYLCGGGTTGGKNIVFLDHPPANKLVCAACETRAAMAQLPTADQICGRHVHVGRVVAQQTCCGEAP